MRTFTFDGRGFSSVAENFISLFVVTYASRYKCHDENTIFGPKINDSCRVFDFQLQPVKSSYYKSRKMYSSIANNLNLSALEKFFIPCTQLIFSKFSNRLVNLRVFFCCNRRIRYASRLILRSLRAILMWPSESASSNGNCQKSITRIRTLQDLKLRLQFIERWNRKNSDGIFMHINITTVTDKNYFIYMYSFYLCSNFCFMSNLESLCNPKYVPIHPT